MDQPQVQTLTLITVALALGYPSVFSLPSESSKEVGVEVCGRGWYATDQVKPNDGSQCAQMFNMSYPAAYHQQHNNIPWQHVQPVYGGMGGLPQPMYNPYIGTPVNPSNAYTNHVSYPPQPRDNQFEGTTSGHVLLP
jgi:hypothetical protein